MKSACRKAVLFSLLFVVLFGYATAESEEEVSRKLISAPHKNVRTNVIDGTGNENTLGFEDINNGIGEAKGGNSKVSISTVALFTLAMAAAIGFSGLGAVPFFFVELDPQWAGLCNGMAAGVMLAASFDLIQEGQGHGAGNWVVFGILAGGIFILLCKKFLEQYGEVSMLELDIKGADATKVVLMTLHSFGKGSGVGVSFAGSKGFCQGLLVTLAIAVHNIPEGLAVRII